jgi:hypothetical protein
MIRIVLLGRTGNNLFQYGLGRVLSKRHGVPLVLDGSWFNAAGWREVSHFLKLPIQAKVTRNWHLPSRILRKLNGKHRWQYLGCPFLSEKDGDHSFDPSFLDAPADCTLFGYFQSWKYLTAIEVELREEINDLLSTSCREVLRSNLARDSRTDHSFLNHPESVAVHVRRGDFLHQSAFQVCDHAYYQKAMDGMRARLTSPRFFVFSDEPAWCRNEFTDADVEIMDAGLAAANPLHDLHLMSLAKHHIIANSSYSWWGAWLGKKENQVVVTPPQWFSKDIIAPMNDKLYPGWVSSSL